MRLVHEQADDNYKPWAEFEVEKGKKYYNFEEVTKKIEEFTDKIAGKNKGGVIIYQES
jgi:hypothetical protein